MSIEEVQAPQEVSTVFAKYIFVDVVRFTQRRSVEAQSEIIATINDIVKFAIDKEKIPSDDLILLPTGDGICIVILELDQVYDVHLRIARHIIERLHSYNAGCRDDMRKFTLRIGINANIDNLVVDVNNRRNIAGAGINIAARVMAVADGNQILVGQVVYNTLSQREKYLTSFKSFHSVAKHGTSVPVFQLIDDTCLGLNNDIPSTFLPTVGKEDPKLSLFVAYYIAHALKSKQVILQAMRKSDGDLHYSFAASVLLVLLADDSVDALTATEFYQPRVATHGAGTATFEEQLNYYREQDFYLNGKLSELLYEARLSDFFNCFVDDFANKCFVTETGKLKLLSDHPAIYADFGID